MSKNEGNITVQLYKVALRTGHSEAICNCQGSLLSLGVIKLLNETHGLKYEGNQHSRV